MEWIAIVIGEVKCKRDCFITFDLTSLAISIAYSLPSYEILHTCFRFSSISVCVSANYFGPQF